MSKCLLSNDKASRRTVEPLPPLKKSSMMFIDYDLGSGKTQAVLHYGAPWSMEYQAISYEWGFKEPPPYDSPPFSRRKMLARYMNGNTRTRVGGILNGRPVDAIPDNCSTHNIIPMVDVENMAAADKVAVQTHHFGLPNRTVMKSMGTINLPFAFPDEPGKVYDLLFYVVENCPSGIILGKNFLKQTQLFAKENLHRLKRCFSSISSRMSFRLIDDTSQRLHGLLADGTGMDELNAAILDVGSDRNVMSLAYARSKYHYIKRCRKHIGIIVFADGSENETVGQVETSWTFASGKRVSVTYQVLRECFADVVLGDEFIWENEVYHNHADSIQDLDTELAVPDLHFMGWKQKWFGELAQIANSIGASGAGSASVSSSTSSVESQWLLYDEEMQRQEEWNERYEDGHLSPLVEWYAEHQRREIFEKWLSPDWHFDPSRQPLIDRYSREHPP